MKKFVLLVVTLLLSMSAFARYKPSKCVIKMTYKVEREGNKQYLWCLGDWEEDGYRYFYTTRRLSLKNITEEACEQLAEEQIGQTRALKFMDPMPAGMMIVGFDPEPLLCDGTVVEISKIKYRPAKIK